LVHAANQDVLHPLIGPHPGSFTRNIIKPWRQGYNTLLPHGTWGNLTPEEFEQVSRKGPPDAVSSVPSGESRRTAFLRQVRGAPDGRLPILWVLE
jgi:hypothetical protein